MVLRLIVIAIAFSGSVAHSKSFTDKQAARVSGSSTLVQAGAAYAVKGLPQLLSKVAVSNPIVYQGLTDVDITKIIGMVDDTWLARTGLGTIGGADVSLTYDAGQAARMMGASNGKKVLSAIAETGEGTVVYQGLKGAAATSVALDAAEKVKPAVATDSIYARLVGSRDQLKTKLEAIKGTEAGIVEVRVRGVLPRYIGGGAAGVMQIVFVSGAVANLFNAYDFAMSTGSASTAAWTSKCKGTDSKECEMSWTSPSTYLTALYNTSDAVFYKWYADN